MKRIGGMCLGGLSVLMVILSCLPNASGAATPTEPGQGESAAEAPYVVKKGDTLWGISRDLLQDPLLWPRVWDRNKFISNPNKIFPGDQLMVPGKELAPAPEPVAEAPKPETPKSEPVAPEPPKETAAAPPPPPAPVEAKPEPPVPPASQHAMVCSPVLVSDDPAMRVGTGELVKAPDDRVMLSMEDRVFVGLDAGGSLNAGDRLAAVRVGRRIIHPQTGRSSGRILYVLGLLEVTEVKGRVARARISYSCGPIGVGDRIAPFAPAAFPEETPQPARRAVTAAVLDALRGEALMGLQQVAFVNVGANQGIAPGDIFAMMRPNAPVPTGVGAILPLPPDRVGDAVVLRVADGTATVLLTASSQEIRVGDQAVLSHQIAP